MFLVQINAELEAIESPKQPELQKSVVLEEEEDNKFGNILISDYSSNSIFLNPEFELIHKISVSSPFGITMD